eukprot:CAMPEP_0185473912 /NCGR_PEP_ID=MMETSP1366-20130426/1748_1 /TAXON_ID=38817 /ORGANISM="Gephyrocapsa oceanica, Strain RCC1303" /LENGTH=117 /DNA_ID=CAMNT_0028080795 /DNA_START=96 /DNA_END=446 /DNA_ORIENTATION=-
MLAPQHAWPSSAPLLHACHGLRFGQHNHVMAHTLRAPSPPPAATLSRQQLVGRASAYGDVDPAAFAAAIAAAFALSSAMRAVSASLSRACSAARASLVARLFAAASAAAASLFAAAA